MKDEFLEQLAALCEQYSATFRYTTNDDGIHIDVGGEEVFAGFMLTGKAAASELRAAKRDFARRAGDNKATDQMIDRLMPDPDGICCPLCHYDGCWDGTPKSERRGAIRELLEKAFREEPAGQR